MRPEKHQIIQIYVGIRAIKNVEYSHLAQLLDSNKILSSILNFKPSHSAIGERVEGVRDTQAHKMCDISNEMKIFGGSSESCIKSEKAFTTLAKLIVALSFVMCDVRIVRAAHGGKKTHEKSRVIIF